MASTLVGPVHCSGPSATSRGRRRRLEVQGSEVAGTAAIPPSAAAVPGAAWPARTEDRRLPGHSQGSPLICDLKGTSCTPLVANVSQRAPASRPRATAQPRPAGAGGRQAPRPKTHRPQACACGRGASFTCKTTQEPSTSLKGAPVTCLATATTDELAPSAAPRSAAGPSRPRASPAGARAPIRGRVAGAVTDLRVQAERGLHTSDEAALPHAAGGTRAHWFLISGQTCHRLCQVTGTHSGTVSSALWHPPPVKLTGLAPARVTANPERPPGSAHALLSSTPTGRRCSPVLRLSKLRHRSIQKLARFREAAVENEDWNQV